MRKNKKFALGFKIATLLTCITLVSVGFASWLIVKSVDPVKAEGSVEAYAVSETGLTLKFNEEADQQSFTFGKVSTSTPEYNWLQATTDVTEEKLTVTYTLTVTPENVSNYSVTLTFNAGTGTGEEFTADNEKIATLLTGSDGKSYLKLAIAVKGDKEELTSKQEFTSGSTYTLTLTKSDLEALFTTAPTANKEFNVTVTVTFSWGDYTEKMNPYQFYNNEAYNVDLAAQAETILGAIYSNTKGANLTYQLVASGTVTAAQA